MLKEIYFIPSKVFLTMGKSEYVQRAIIAGNLPIPKNGMMIASNASDGLVCKIDETARAIPLPTLLLDRSIPKGIAIVAPNKSAKVDINKCSPIFKNKIAVLLINIVIDYLPYLRIEQGVTHLPLQWFG